MSFKMEFSDKDLAEIILLGLRNHPEYKKYYTFMEVQEALSYVETIKHEPLLESYQRFVVPMKRVSPGLRIGICDETKEIFVHKELGAWD